VSAFQSKQAILPSICRGKIACFCCIIRALISGGVPMISNQEFLNLSPFMAIYDLDEPKDNMLRQINELVDFSFNLAQN
jgi:hypothetical protein